MAARYDLPASRLADAQALVARFARKATKLGFAAPSLTVVETYTRYWLVTRDGQPVGPHSDRVAPVVPADSQARLHVRSLDLATVEIAGERPVLAGYRFCAVIEATPAGNLLRKSPSFEGELPERFRACTSECDHCRTDRQRNETFVVEHVESGEFRQVGRSCLADFLAVASPDAWIASYLYERQIAALCEWGDDYGCGSASAYVPVAMFLPVVAAVARRFGYVSASAARASVLPRTSTGVEVYGALTSKDGSAGEYQDMVTPVDLVLAEAALAWLGSDAVGDVSDYIHNLRVAVGGDIVTHRTCNLLASLLSAYDRDLTRRAEKAAKVNEYLPGAAIKAKLEVIDATVTRIRAIEGDYGLTYLVGFDDANGRSIVWWASNPRGFDVGDTVTIKGSVKALTEYKGTLQTVLTRCKVFVTESAEDDCDEQASEQERERGVEARYLEIQGVRA